MTDQLIQRLKKAKWHYIHRRVRSPFYMHLIWEGCSNRFNSQIPFAYQKVDWIALDQNIAATDGTWEALRKVVKRHLGRSPRLLLNLLKASYKENAKIESFCRKLEKVDFNDASRSQLLKYWHKYIDFYNKFAAYLLLPLFIEPDMEARLRKIIARNFPDQDGEKIFQILTTPQVLGTAQQDEKRLLELAVKMKQNKLTDAEVSRYLRQFSWIKNNSFSGVFYTKPEMMRRIRTAAKKAPAEKLAEFKKRHAGTKKEFVKYAKVIAQEPTDKILLDTLQECIFHRSWRTERYYHNAYFLQGFFASTTKALVLENPHDLFYLVNHEIFAGLEGREQATQLIQLVKERRQGYMVYTEPGLSAVYSGVDLAEAKKVIKLFGAASQKEIRGATAYPGFATGTAVVIKSKHELKKIKPGSILVCPSTTVDFVPYLKKVKAIVADEGGILSHASVISRELHIPCVIGAKHATHLLRDGMKLEVDAKNGTVKVL